MRRTNTEPLKEVIRQFLKIYGNDTKIKEVRLQNAWGKIAGKTIEQQTEFVKISKSVFYVKLSSSILKHELMMMKSQIITRLNEEAGENMITKIVFL